MKIQDKILKGLANLAETAAIRSNGMSSWWDSYQPVEPEAVRKLAKEKKNSKKTK